MSIAQDKSGPRNFLKYILRFSGAILFSTAVFASSSPATKYIDNKLILVNAGSFVPLYGSKNKAPVSVESFEMNQYPITNGEFLNFVKVNSKWQRSRAPKIFVDNTYLAKWESSLKPGKNAPLDAPVTQVSWYAANAYCQSKGLRLLTINEWEYAASHAIAGQDIKRVILDWYSIPSPKILPSVNSGLTNSLGIACMHGLIWEWTLDYNSAMIAGESRGSDSLDKSMFCGSGSLGSADATDYSAFIRYGMRSSLKSNFSVANLGFRCGRSIGDLKGGSK